MDKITYAGESFLTGSAIAHALMDYAQALAQVAGSAMVEFPALDDAGEPVRSEILLGPASQILSTTVSTDREEVEDADLVARLARAADELRRDSPAPMPGQIVSPLGEDWPDYEF